MVVYSIRERVPRPEWFQVTYRFSFFSVIKMYCSIPATKKEPGLSEDKQSQENVKGNYSHKISKNMLEWDSMIQVELKPNFLKHLVPFQIIYFFRGDDIRPSDFGDFNMLVHILEMIHFLYSLASFWNYLEAIESD